MIELEHATKKYGAIYGLRDVTLHIGKGETVGLLGRNGAGKTTALNLITGYFPPTAGTVRIKCLASAAVIRWLNWILMDAEPKVPCSALTSCTASPGERGHPTLAAVAEGRRSALPGAGSTPSPSVAVTREPGMGVRRSTTTVWRFVATWEMANATSASAALKERREASELVSTGPLKSRRTFARRFVDIETCSHLSRRSG